LISCIARENYRGWESNLRGWSGNPHFPDDRNMERSNLTSTSDDTKVARSMT
jgi:hypothetical protein